MMAEGREARWGTWPEAESSPLGTAHEVGEWGGC